MKNFMFHGGCQGCNNDISRCHGCCFMDSNWNLPDLNTDHSEREKERQGMVRIAKSYQYDRKLLN